MVQLHVCEVCMDNFSEANLPKLLHCGHTFCRACIDKLPKIGVLKGAEAVKPSTSESFLIQCPVCREFTHLRVGQELATNFAFLSLLSLDSSKESIASTEKKPEKESVFQEESKVPLCEECETAISEVFCQNCESYMCKACQATSHSSKIFKKHVVIDSLGPVLVAASSKDSALESSVVESSMVASSAVSASSVAKCSFHSQDLILYCFTCDEAICLVCRDYAAHTSHKVDLIENVTSTLHCSLTKKLARMVSLKETMTNALSLVQTRQCLLIDDENELLTKLTRTFAELQALLDEKLKLSLERVKAKAKSSSESLMSMESNLLKDLADLNNILKSCDSLELKQDIKVIHELQLLNSSQEELLKREPAIEEMSSAADSRWFMQSTLAAVKTSIETFEGVFFDQTPEFLTEIKETVESGCDVELKWKKPLDDTVGYELRISRIGDSKEEVKSDSQTMFFTNSETSYKVAVSEPDSTYVVKLRYVTDGSASQWTTLKMETAPIVPIKFSEIQKAKFLKVSEDGFTVTDTGKNGSFVSILSADEFTTGKHSWRVHVSTLCIVGFGVCTNWSLGKAEESGYEGLWNVWNSGACTMNGGIGDWDFFGDFSCREGDIVKISLDLVARKVGIKNETSGSFASFKIPKTGTFVPWFAVYGSKLQLL